MIRKVGPQDTLQDHTPVFTAASLYPRSLSRESYLNWEKGGSLTLEERALEAVDERLSS